MRKALLGPAMVAILCLSIFQPFAATPTFSDVPSSHWAFSAIEKMASKEVVSGVGGGKFNPDGQVSTGQFVTMMTRAFYPDALAAAVSPVSDWWGANMFVAHLCGMTKGTLAAATETPIENGKVLWDSAVVDAPMTCYDMAQVMYNYIWSFRDMPSDGELAAVKAKIADFSSIPAKYQTAVLNVFALNCLTGVDATGRFAGDQPMSRAQAAVVLGRIFTLKEQGSVPTQPNETPVTPIVPPQPSGGSVVDGGSYDIKRYTVPADADRDGVLTEAEVSEALMDLKSEYPEGSSWDDERKYQSPNFTFTGSGCAAFAMELSDKIYGNLPVRTIGSIEEIRIGDIFENKALVHWGVFIDLSDGEYADTAAGNVGDEVTWSGYGSYKGLTSLLQTGKCVVYTRYPQ